MTTVSTTSASKRRVSKSDTRMGGLRSSTGVDFDHHGHAVGDDVVDGRAPARLLDDLAQLLGVVTPQLEADLDPLEAVADLVGEPENAEQIDVALDGRLDL